VPGHGYVVTFGDHDPQGTFRSVYQAAIRGRRNQIQVHPHRTNHNHFNADARGRPRLGQIDPRERRLYRFERGGTNCGGVRADKCSQPSRPGQGVGRVRRRFGSTVRHHCGHCFIQGLAGVLAGSHLDPGVTVVAAHANFQVTIDDPGDLEAKYLAAQDAML
jgi:hypothetical protein